MKEAPTGTKRPLRGPAIYAVALLLCLLALVLCVRHAIRTVKQRPKYELRFDLERASMVMVNIHRPDGTLARQLIRAQQFPAGSQAIAWDGRADDGAELSAGEYAWCGFAHEGAAWPLRSWWTAGSGANALFPPDWSGWMGVPSAVAADAEKVYLGWSVAEQGKAVWAGDLDGRVQWRQGLGEGVSGCRALAVDDGLLYVLGGLAGTDAGGDAVYRLNAKDGKPVPWPNGQLDLKITALWPADSQAKPNKADAMAVRHDRIYLTFTSSEFLAVLDARTGAYLQTVVGAPPGQIDVAPTQTDLPDAPGKLVDADFAVITLGGGVLGKVLFAHDPLWVVTSELTPMERDVRINALTVIGDGAKHHRHTAFIGLGEPFHQLQARLLLDTEGFIWAAGQPGGRPLLGPWQADALRDIRSVALAADGKLWVAEGDAFPRRFSVWDTSGKQGKLVREFFAAPELVAAVSPLDPQVIFAGGCEWRIAQHTVCLGVVAREPAAFAAYGVAGDGKVYLLTSPSEDGGDVRIFERIGDGDYQLRTELMSAEQPRFLPGGKITVPAAK